MCPDVFSAVAGLLAAQGEDGSGTGDVASVTYGIASLRKGTLMAAVVDFTEWR
jgi:hypothetical protein